MKNDDGLKLKKKCNFVCLKVFYIFFLEFSALTGSEEETGVKKIFQTMLILATRTRIINCTIFPFYIFFHGSKSFPTYCVENEHILQQQNCNKILSNGL